MSNDIINTNVVNGLQHKRQISQQTDFKMPANTNVARFFFVSTFYRSVDYGASGSFATLILVTYKI